MDCVAQRKLATFPWKQGDPANAAPGHRTAGVQLQVPLLPWKQAPELLASWEAPKNKKQQMAQQVVIETNQKTFSFLF